MNLIERLICIMKELTQINKKLMRQPAGFFRIQALSSKICQKISQILIFVGLKQVALYCLHQFQLFQYSKSMTQTLIRKRRVLTQGNDKYNKISHKARIVLLKKVLCDGCEIKQTAFRLDINYSTAKTLMRKFKSHGQDLNFDVLRGMSDWFDIYSASRTRCSYRTIQTPNLPSKSRKQIRKVIQQQAYEQNLAENNRKNCPEQKLRPTPVKIMQQVFFRE